MKLGIFVNTDKHLGHITGLAKAAVSKGHEVHIFTMDDGAKLLENPSFTALCKTPGVKMSYCDHTAAEKNIKKTGIPAEVVCGSQYNNAVMAHEVDRLIVL
jgi:predicted peroxiredoxin